MLDVSVCPINKHWSPPFYWTHFPGKQNPQDSSAHFLFTPSRTAASVNSDRFIAHSFMGTKTLPWLVMGHAIAVSSKNNSCNTSPLHSALQSQHYFGGNKCFWLCVWVIIQKSLWWTTPPAPPPGEPCSSHPTRALTPVPLCLTRGWQGTEGSPCGTQKNTRPLRSSPFTMDCGCSVRLVQLCKAEEPDFHWWVAMQARAFIPVCQVPSAGPSLGTHFLLRSSLTQSVNLTKGLPTFLTDP